MKTADVTVHRNLIEKMMEDADDKPAGIAADSAERTDRCFYTLWGREDEITWETQSSADLTNSIVPGTGRQDWRKLRPFDMLSEPDAGNGRVARLELYRGNCVRVSAAHIAGPEGHFERAADFDTILVQYVGASTVETGFGIFELYPGEAMLVPAMVAHRTTGTPNCRRMEYRVRDLVTPHLPAAEGKQKLRFCVYPKGEARPDDVAIASALTPNGRIREHLSRWDDLPGEDFWIERTHKWLVGNADRGRAPIKIRPFEHFKKSAPTVNKLPPVRTALLWDSATFRQRVYSNPGRQPAPHRGYDEDELWFQFVGPIGVETEHGIYKMENGTLSMAEAGVSHTSDSTEQLYRLTSYSPQPIRMVVKPDKHLRETEWMVDVVEVEAEA